jgi:hypothetical protein
MGAVKTVSNPTLDRLLHLNTLIQLHDRKYHEYSKRKIQARLKDIELMLRDFNDPQAVRALTELTDKYNPTTDYVSFNKKLVNYRDSLVGRYLHWR